MSKAKESSRSGRTEYVVHPYGKRPHGLAPGVLAKATEIIQHKAVLAVDLEHSLYFADLDALGRFFLTARPGGEQKMLALGFKEFFLGCQRDKRVMDVMPVEIVRISSSGGVTFDPYRRRPEGRS